MKYGSDELTGNTPTFTLSAAWAAAGEALKRPPATSDAAKSVWVKSRPSFI